MAISRRPVEHEPPPDGEAAEWRSLYDIDDAGEVEAFVARRPDLEAILARAPRQIAARFDEALRPVLRLEADQEDDPPSEYLVIGIPTGREYDDAQARLARLDDEWWLDEALPVVGADVVVQLAWQ
jgi:hypothetical protein